MLISLLPEYTLLTFQTFLYPLTNFILPFFIRTLKERKKFENKNLIEPAAQSFKQSGLRAHHCFEISSEGEFEQVAPLLIDLLKCDLRIELIFCSPSVEKQVESLTRQYKNLRVFRLPLISFSWFPSYFGQSALDWTTAPSILLCRYDFFPELMIMVKRLKGQLISATLIGKKRIPWHLKRYYHFFSELLVATPSDKTRFQSELSLPSSRVNFLELRFIQIERRLSQKNQILDSKAVSAAYHGWLKATSQKKLIIGSMWPIEIDLFSFSMKQAIKKQQLHVAIFPHNLHGAAYDQLIERLVVILEDIPVLVVDEKTSVENLESNLAGPVVIVFKIKGMLCEYYSLFNDAFIGGGHGRSIHSILEPFLAGPILFCGPGTHRSTEFLVVKETTPTELVVVEKLELFYENLIQYSGATNFDKRLALIKEMNARYQVYFERFTKERI